MIPTIRFAKVEEYWTILLFFHNNYDYQTEICYTTFVMNPMILLQLKQRLDAFRATHPKFQNFLSFIHKNAIEEGSVSFYDPIFYLARQFSKADSIVIAAPYWDLSFPAALKQYFEQINVLGITFEYSAEGTPIPLCAAKELIYITTAGGAFVPEEYGFGYVKALAQGFYGIKNVRQIKAIGLDIYGADADQIIEDTLKHI